MLKHQILKIIVNIILPPILVIILFAVSLGAVIIPSTENALMEKKKETIQAIVKSAISIIEKHVEMEADGSATHSEAQEIALVEMRALRYGDENNDYLWIINLKPAMLMHPYFPELEGKDLSEYYDIEGRRFFVEAADIAKKDDSGYIFYSWPKEHKLEEPLPKLSYIQLVNEWGWVVGSGIYLDDVENEIRTVTLRIILVSTVIGIIVAILLLLIVFRGLTGEQKRLNAEREVEKTRNAYKALAQASGEMILLTENQIVTAVNKKACKILGYDEFEMLGHNFSEFMTDDTGIDFLNRIRSGESAAAFEIIIKGKEKNLPILINAEQTIVNEENAVIFSGFPVHEDHSGDYSCVDTELLNRNSFGTFLIKGIYSGKISDADEMAENLLEVRDIDGMDFRKIFVSEDSNRFFTQLRMNNKIDAMVLRHETEKGEIKYFRIWASLLEKPAELRGKIFVMFNNITDNRKINVAKSALITEFISPDKFFSSDTKENSEQISINDIIYRYNRNKVIAMYSAEIGISAGKISGNLALSVKQLFSSALDKAFEELGMPPCRFAFLGLGSIGRQEPTLSADQDTAIIYENTESNEENTEYFKKLGRVVTSICEKAGMPICDGGNSASNGKWCKNVRQWESTFKKWVLKSTPENLLKINIFFDFHTLAGEKSFAIELRKYVINVIEKNPVFLYNLAQNIMSYVLPADFIGRIRKDSRTGNHINIKGILLHYVNFARIYALKNKIYETNTIKRLEVLKENKGLPDDIIENSIDAYLFLMSLRMKNQELSMETNFSEENIIILDNLHSMEKNQLKKAAVHVQDIQRRIGADFVRRGWS